MTQLNKVFYAEEGTKITLTSAAHLCAIAAQEKEKYNLSRISFVNTTISVIGSGKDELPTEKGITDENLPSITESLKQVSKLNVFIAWFAEARKNLEAYEASIPSNWEQWLREQGRESECGKDPTFKNNFPEPTFEDMIEELDVKQRQRYLALEAKSACLGKFIHQDEPFDKARKRLHTIINEEYDTRGNGRDTVVSHYLPSVEVEKVDKLFEQIQNEYRQTEQQLNSIKSDLKKKLLLRKNEIAAQKTEALNKYQEEHANFLVKLQRIQAEYYSWKENELAKIAKLKFTVPNELMDTYEYLNSLGQEKK